MIGTINDLAIATGLFVGIHIVPSSFLRAAIVRAIGEKGYLAAYSLISVVLLVWMIVAYFAAPYGDVMWELGNGARYLAIAGMVVSSILFVGPFTGPNPTAMGGQSLASKESARSGINAITRHPLMWAFVIWSVVHMLNNGDMKSVIFFTGFGGLALAGTFLIDAKRAREMGAEWSQYAAQTSNIPFLAIIQGRAKISISMLWWRVIIGLFIFMAFFHTHTMLIGVPPFPL